MELFCYAGYGGEFCIGKLTEEQTDFVFANGENEEYDLDSFWEDNEIMDNKPWYDFDEIARHNTTQLKNVLLMKRADIEKGIDGEFFKITTEEALSRFEIDLENDDRFEFSKEKNKVILGWNKTGANFDKGFHTLRVKDFSDENIKFFSGDSPCLIGSQSSEAGDMWSIEVPDDFDINKLIPIAVDFHIQDDEKISLTTNLIYEGKFLEINLGDTETRELKHFVMECNYDPDEEDENVGFDYALEFIK